MLPVVGRCRPRPVSNFLFGIRLSCIEVKKRPVARMKSQSTTVIPIFLIGLLLMVSHGGSSEIYKWKDKNGNIFFSDSPPPPGVDAEIKKFKEEPNGKPKPEVSTPQPKSELPREMRSYGNITVIMYMTSWCGYSRKAREYLQSLNVNLIEYDIEKEMGKR